MTKMFFVEDQKNEQIKGALVRKPFFNLIYTFSFKYQFQISNTLTILYYIVITANSCRLVFLLDAFKFNVKNILGKKVIAYALAHQLFFLNTIWELIKFYCSMGFYSEALLNFVVFFTFNMYNNTTFILLHYTQYCTLQELSQLDKHCSINHFRKKLSKLSKITFQLYQLLSVPLCFYILPYVTQTIVTLSTLYIKNFSDFNNYFFQIIFNVLTFAVLNRAIHRQLMAICEPNSFLPIKNNFLTHIKQEAVNIYQNYFQLKIFDICCINWNWLVNLALFILNYMVLVIQTEKLN